MDRMPTDNANGVFSDVALNAFWKVKPNTRCCNVCASAIGPERVQPTSRVFCASTAKGMGKQRVTGSRKCFLDKLRRCRYRRRDLLDLSALSQGRGRILTVFFLA